MPRVTWKSRLQKALANAPDDQHRAKAEEKERQRWIRELMMLLEDAGFLASPGEGSRGHEAIGIQSGSRQEGIDAETTCQVR